MSRIAETFARTKAAGRTVFVGYIMAYDPTLEVSKQFLLSMPQHGVDVIELGMPFSDPSADGISIQLAAGRALQQGANIAGILAMVKEFRQIDTTTPIILMGYYNPVYHYGVHSFILDAVHAGVDGVILVDLPPEEEAEFQLPAAQAGLAMIKLTAPTTDAARAKIVCQHASGFVYHIAVAGVTGGKSADTIQLQAGVQTIRTATHLPIVVGFGIRSPQQAKDIAQYADGIVIGSALVDYAAKNDLKGFCEFLDSVSAVL